MDHQDPEIIAMFFDEVEEQLTTLNDGLLYMEEDLESAKKDKDKIAELFRAFHTIKGASGMLGFDRVNRLTHAGETLLDEVRESRLELHEGIVEALFEAVDGLTQLIEGLESGSDSVDLEEICQRLDETRLSSHAEAQSKDSSSESPTPAAATTAAKPIELEGGLDVSKYLPAFLDDTADSITVLEELLVKIDQELKQETFELKADDVNELFRHAHQIKGSSGAMGFVGLNELTHAMESLLSDLRNEEIVCSPDIISVLLQATDLIKACVDGLQAGEGGSIDPSEVLIALNRFVAKETQSVASAEGALQFTYSDKERVNQALDRGNSCYQITIHVSRDEKVAGMRAYASVAKILNQGTILLSMPDLDDLPMLNECFRHEFVMSSTAGIDELKTALLIDQIEKVEIESLEKFSLQDIQTEVDKEGAPSSRATSSQTLRVDIDRLDQLMNMSGELVISKAQFMQIASKLSEIVDHKQLCMRLQFMHESFQQLSCLDELRRPELGLLKSRIELMSTEAEILYEGIYGLQQGKLIYHDFQEAVHQMDLVSNGIQKSIMDIRMVPVGPLFNRFKRVVRDTCKATNKDITLVINGQDTELDKKMIDELGDPLTHMVRNAADHGIETPGERKAAGKKEQGTVILDAFHQGNRICITIKDDGRGLDLDRIRAKAVEKGIFTDESVALLSDKEVSHLIFHPGFSTAQQVTNISGRGVGMDIVRKKIEQLNGLVEIETKRGVGSTFTISLPLTLAIQKSLLCVIHGTTYALPLESVVEIVKRDQSGIQSVNQDDVVRVRDSVIPIKRLDQIFRRTRFKTIDESTDIKTLVILGNDKNHIALAVHTLIGEEDIVIKSLNRNMNDVYGVAGASILGNGDIALILDIEMILETMSHKSHENNQEAMTA